MTPRKSHLMTTGEVAEVFRVDPHTVRRWAKNGKITRLQTVGGRGRYVRSEIEKLATNWRQS